MIEENSIDLLTFSVLQVKSMLGGWELVNSLAPVMTRTLLHPSLWQENSYRPGKGPCYTVSVPDRLSNGGQNQWNTRWQSYNEPTCTQHTSYRLGTVTGLSDGLSVNNLLRLWFYYVNIQLLHIMKVDFYSKSIIWFFVTLKKKVYYLEISKHDTSTVNEFSD